MMNRLCDPGKRIIANLPIRSAIAGCLLVCLLLNSLLPRFTIGQDEQSTLEKVFQSQSALLHVFCMTALPLKIVNDIVSDGTAPNRQAHKKDSRGRSDNGNASSDYSVVNFDKGQQWARALLRGTSEINDIPVLVAVASVALLLDRQRSNLCGERSARRAMVLRFFLLPRSSVGDHNPATVVFAVH